MQLAVICCHIAACRAGTAYWLEHAQVQETQKDALKAVKEAAENHVQENQRELSRNTLAPTVRVRLSSTLLASFVRSFGTLIS